MTNNIKDFLWIIPSMITIISLLIAYVATPKSRGGPEPDLVSLSVGGIYTSIALAVSLINWVLYAAFK